MKSPRTRCGNDCWGPKGHAEGCPAHCHCYDTPEIERPLTARMLTPNVMAATWRTDDGTVVTLYRTTPGDTTPRIIIGAMTGTVANPERFGPVGVTLDDFTRWCRQYKSGQEV